MKKLFIFGIAFLILSCNTQRRTTVENSHKESSILKTELFFSNCDSILAFLKTMVINNNMDKNLKQGHFRLQFVDSSYKNVKSLFPEKCFIGMPAKDLIAIFGEWDYSGVSENHPAWYVLENINNRLAIEIYVRGGVIEKFKVAPSTVDSINPANK
jgi:hypothetical protein